MTSYGEDPLGTSRDGSPAHATTRTTNGEWSEWRPRVKIGSRFRLGLRVAESYLDVRPHALSVEETVLVVSKRHSLKPSEVFDLLRWMGVEVR